MLVSWFKLNTQVLITVPVAVRCPQLTAAFRLVWLTLCFVWTYQSTRLNEWDVCSLSEIWKTELNWFRLFFCLSTRVTTSSQVLSVFLYFSYKLLAWDNQIQAHVLHVTCIICTTLPCKCYFSCCWLLNTLFSFWENVCLKKGFALFYGNFSFVKVVMKPNLDTTMHKTHGKRLF